jgi:branched-chain amino acid transport system substrate-binding protein
LPAGPWTIALDMPLSRSDDAVLGVLIRDAVQMAIDDVNATGVSGTSLSLRVFDDFDTTEQAQVNAAAIVADPTVIGMIGPWHSGTTFGVLPITNEGGLLECSPSATHPGLTKPRFGALDLRVAHPEANTFVRIPPADDIQAVALAAFAYRDLAARSVLIVDESAVGRELADAFEASYEKLGGLAIRRTMNPGAGAASVLDPLVSADPPQVVFVAARPETAAAVRTAMADDGFSATPLLSWDALLYYSVVYFKPAGLGPYVQMTTAQVADGTYVAHATVPDYKFSFADAYRTRFHVEPDEYAAAGYACVEIIAAALQAIAQSGPAAADLRDLVRSYVTDPAHRFDTVVGNVGFDANGDALQQFVTFYRFDASAANGAGDWGVFKKQDFGPAP